MSLIKVVTYVSGVIKIHYRVTYLMIPGVPGALKPRMYPRSRYIYYISKILFQNKVAKFFSESFVKKILELIFGNFIYQ